VHENEREAIIENLLARAKLNVPAMTKYQLDMFDLPSGVLLQKHERGELLYRNIFGIRCWF